MEREERNNARSPYLERNINIFKLTTFLSGIRLYVVNVVLQPFVLSLYPSMTFVGLLQGLSGMNGLITTIVQPISGWISDRKGRKKLILLGSTFTIASLLLFSFAGFLGAAFLLLPSAILMGVSFIRRPSESSIVAESVKKERRSYAYSIITLAMVAPGIFAPYVGGLVADNFGFASVFLIAALIEGICLLFLSLYLRETLEGESKNLPGRDEFLLFLKRIIAPPSSVRGLYLICALDSLMWGFGGYILTGLMRKEFGFTNAQLGLLNSASNISWALLQIPIGHLIQRFGCKISLILSEAVGILAIMGFIFSNSFENFLIFEIPMGLVPALWIPAINTLIANATSEEERAETFGRLWLLRGIVGFPGPIIGGFIYNSFGFDAPLIANMLGATLDMCLIYFFVREQS